jgi:hypothetical protein
VSVWNENRYGVPPRHALGLWHPFAKLASQALFPTARERRALAGKTRFSYAFNFPAVPVGGVANDRIAVLSDFYWTDTISSPVASGGFLSSVSLFETKGKQRYSNPNLVSGAIHLPFFERRITKISAGAMLLMRLQNNAAAVQTFQVVLGGYID